MATTIAVILAVVSAVLLAGLIYLLIDRGKSAAALASARSEREAALAARDAVLNAQAQRETDLALAQSQLADAEREKAVIAERERALIEQREKLREELLAMREQFKSDFAALAGQALERSSDSFLKLARQTFEKEQQAAQGDLDKKQQAIDALIKPIRELLEKHNTAVGELEKKRETAYVRLDEQIRTIAASHERLGTETGRLVSALRRPEQRGRWGELQLRNVVELAGMTEHCDFQEQVQTDDPSTRDRPDMIVHLPGGGVIVVDSKVSLDAYLNSIQPDADRTAELKKHTDHIETNLRRLSSKAYWKQFERTPRLVVMFMPLESALFAALEIKPDLHAEAMKQHVLIATPTLLVATLRAVAYGWQQEAIAANAREIADCGRELYDRLGTFADHLSKVGSSLQGATKSYNAAIGSLERMVLPGARRLRDLRATTKDELSAPRPLELEPREIASAELQAEGEGE